MSSDSSFPPQLKTVSIEVKDNYVVITLNRAPVNGMNLDLWSDLLSAIDATERQAKMRGAIFASGLVKDIFTAGNDLNELYSKSTTPERYHRFWIAQTTCLSRLYSTRLATVATIRGACPAGGCVFAMCCDYRLMTSDVPGAVIGLNEVALGISVPRYWIRLYERQLGNKAAELALLTGSMLTPEQAVKGGLLHAAVPKAELSSAGEAALKLLTTPAVTAALGKVIAKLSGGAAAKPKAKL